VKCTTAMPPGTGYCGDCAARSSPPSYSPRPIAPEHIARLRDVALEDLRSATAAQNGRSDLPLTRAYGEKMEELVASLDRALSIGGWRTGVYLLGDEASYWRLAASWRGVSRTGKVHLRLSGSCLLEPPRASRAVGRCPSVRPPPGRVPGGTRSAIKRCSIPGNSRRTRIFRATRRPVFSIRPAPTFAVSRAAPKPRTPARVIEIGEVLEQRAKTGGRYQLDLDELTRHAFVAGLTGSGKTNTLMSILTQIAAKDVPFLVIEPAKTEYRELLAGRGSAHGCVCSPLAGNRSRHCG